MKTLVVTITSILLTLSSLSANQSWIRINQLGYQENAVKAAVFVSLNDISVESFELINSENNEVVLKSEKVKGYGNYGSFKRTYRLDFSEFNTEGKYYLLVKEIKSSPFRISDDVYDGTADFVLNYMRQQRCGYNPFLKDSCHTQDGFIVDYPEKDSAYINVTGGWHDASDYLQYLTTSANATFQMLFAYSKNPDVFHDEFDANGDSGENGIPDILDEAKWGLDWLVKMNPEYGIMFNQIADDRDHSGYRLPNKDSVNYGKGLERPVYLVTGKQQGLAKYKNRSTGVSSSAAKFASAFALGSDLMKKYYPEFSELVLAKAFDAYRFAKTDLGVNQTASNVSPYFYEEDNYIDDMELAAAQLYKTTKNKDYLNEAIYWGKVEPITPWMGADTARHYQWYPFVNIGHYYLANDEKNKSNFFKSYMAKGLEKIFNRGKDNAFCNGVPFIWCSNNLVVAALTQAQLYEDISGSSEFAEMEAALRDWLFGCNPWGTSMIVGLPRDGDTPTHPHSSLTLLENFETTGGLVDGPVYGTIYKSLLGLALVEPDEYEQFQSDLVVYHDDFGDYSTNEPTMDGTASLTYYLSKLESLGKKMLKKEKIEGAIVRGNEKQKEIYLLFSGGDFYDGNDIILNALSDKNIKGNFFFTGDYYRNPENKSFITKLVQENHYVGAHSDKHLLYASWEDRDSTLIDKEVFTEDLEKNYSEMEKFGVKKNMAKFFLPPYEWYNQEIADWTNEMGIELISFTHGTKSNADYTIPSMGNKYISSEEIFESIINYEEDRTNGLNGFHLLLHVGSHSERTDKFYLKIEDLLDELIDRGYSFNRF